MEVVDSIIAVVSSEDVDAAVVYDSCVTVTGRRRLRAFLGDNFKPVVGLEAEAEEIVPSVGAIVAAKYVEVVLECNRCVQRPGTGWVAFVCLRWLNLMPCVGLF